MKTLIRIAKQVVSSLYASNEPDFASTHILTLFPRRATVEVVHGWKILSPSGRLPVDD